MKEDEVQEALGDWFQQQGYFVRKEVDIGFSSEIDLVAKSENEEWLVEVKGDYGKTAQYTVNFDTGIGQLLKNMSRLDKQTKYAIGIPISTTERGEKLSYRLILPKYSKSLAFESLNIHLLLVRDDRSVEVIIPSRVIDFLHSINPEIQK